jgi:hypothetical protein
VIRREIEDAVRAATQEIDLAEADGPLKPSRASVTLYVARTLVAAAGAFAKTLPDATEIDVWHVESESTVFGVLRPTITVETSEAAAHRCAASLASHCTNVRVTGPHKHLVSPL